MMDKIFHDLGERWKGLHVIFDHNRLRIIAYEGRDKEIEIALSLDELVNLSITLHRIAKLMELDNG